MTISESQLQAWSNQGATDSAQKTHTSIRSALDTYKHWRSGVKYDPYLQGSYRNTTNIRGDSDADLVVELTSVYYSNLTEAEKPLLGWQPASYQWSEFRSDVIAALIEYYGAQYIDTSGNKSVKVLPSSGRLKADVVVAANYCYYENLKIRAQGIIFWPHPQGLPIINYPKLHYENGANKNNEYRTRGWYKPTVRIYKNARNRVVEQRPDLQNRFPSYFIECLLYNVPDGRFGVSFQTSYLGALNWLIPELYSERTTNMVCPNGMAYLFGALSTQWNIDDAREFVTQLTNLWNTW